MPQALLTELGLSLVISIVAFARTPHTLTYLGATINTNSTK